MWAGPAVPKCLRRNNVPTSIPKPNYKRGPVRCRPLALLGPTVLCCMLYLRGVDVPVPVADVREPARLALLEQVPSHAVHRAVVPAASLGREGEGEGGRGKGEKTNSLTNTRG